MKSRILNVASAFLFVVGILGLATAIRDLTVPVDEVTLGVTVSQISGFNPNVMGLIAHLYQSVGVYLLGMALFFCIVSLMPYRKGEKWAWYSMLAIGGIASIGNITLSIVATGVIASFYLPAAILLLVLWAIGIVLPVREIFS